MINGNLKSTYAADEQILNNRYKQAFIVLMVALTACVPLFANDYIVLVASQMGIMLIAIVGVNVVVGYTGLLSLGHGGFVALGAYAVVLFHLAMSSLGVPEGIQPFIAVPLAMAAAAFVGLIVGLPSLRVKGVYLAVATLSANFIILFLIELEAFAPWTGGKQGLTTVDPNILGWGVDTQRETFILIAAMAFATVLLIQNL
ncbi:MAG: branched-chain amino acid ABC transporter permease, partial [Pseudomonadota bacterium]